MTNKERAELIQNAIRDYKAAKESGDTQKIRNAVNDMENTFSAVCLWAVPGTEELRQMILSAKEDEARRIFGSYKRDLIRTAKISGSPQELRYKGGDHLILIFILLLPIAVILSAAKKQK